MDARQKMHAPSIASSMQPILFRLFKADMKCSVSSDLHLILVCAAKVCSLMKLNSICQNGSQCVGNIYNQLCDCTTAQKPSHGALCELPGKGKGCSFVLQHVHVCASLWVYVCFEKILTSISNIYSIPIINSNSY